MTSRRSVVARDARDARGAMRRLRAHAGAVSIGLAVATGFGGLLLMLAVDMHNLLAARTDTTTAASTATAPMEDPRWT